MITNIKNYLYDVAGLGLTTTVLFVTNASALTLFAVAALFVIVLAIFR